MIPAVRFRARRRNSIARQKMNGSAPIYGTPNGTVQLGGFTSDGAFPATVVGGNSMTVAGSDTVKATAAISITNSFAGTHTLQIRRNGSVVVSIPFSATNPYSVEYNGPIMNGDSLSMWVVYDTWGGNVTINARSLDVVAA